MSTLDKEFLKIRYKSVHGTVKAVTFKDGDFEMMYIPSLNLSSYGRTIDEAIEMMQNAIIPDFCKSVLNKNRGLVFRELQKLGWIKNPFFEKDLSKSAHIDKEGILREFELSRDTVLSERNLELAS